MRLIALWTAGLALLATPAAADVQPRDGTWQGTYNLVSAESCPSALVPHTDDIPAANRSYWRDYTFPEPFDPAALAYPKATLTWEKLGENSWRTVHRHVSDSEMGATVTESVVLFDVLSRLEMRHTFAVTITMPDTLARLNGISGSCRMRYTLDHRRVG